MNNLVIVGKLGSYDISTRKIVISMEGMRRPPWEPDEYELEVAEQVADAFHRNYLRYGNCLVAVQAELVKDGNEDREKKVARFVTFLVDAPIRTAPVSQSVESNLIACDMTVEELEDHLLSTEGFAVRFIHPNGRDVRGDRPISRQTWRRSPDDWTGATWKNSPAMRSLLAQFNWDVEILDRNRDAVHGKTLLGTVRSQYV